MGNAFGGAPNVVRDGVATYPSGTSRTACIWSKEPFSKQHPYFEIRILSKGRKGAIAVGAIPPRYHYTRQPGTMHAQKQSKHGLRLTCGAWMQAGTRAASGTTQTTASFSWLVHMAKRLGKSAKEGIAWDVGSCFQVRACPSARSVM